VTPDFSTPRLRAEPLSPAHDAELVVLHADERVMATMGGAATAEESRAWLQRNLRDGDEPGLGVFVFHDRATGELVGRGALRRIQIGGREEVEVGYAVAAERWGRGFATEIARALADHAERHGFRGLIAYTQPTNGASRRVMEKTGFAFERELEHNGRAHVVYRRTGE
jgi:ribosomal-protein-alanine N-acetyltransferase